MMESYQSNHIQQNPQVLQQKRSDDALSVGSDSAYSTDSGGKIEYNQCTWDNLLNIEYFRFKLTFQACIYRFDIVISRHYANHMKKFFSRYRS